MSDTTACAVQPFRSRFPWLGPDLQTLRNQLRGPVRRPAAPGSERRFPMPDGSGDVLTGVLHVPLPRAADPGAQGRPLVLLVHGLTGCAESDYVLATAGALIDAGFSCLRLNLRGAGPTMASARERYHAGRSDDLRAVIAQLRVSGGPARLTANGVMAVGYSLGGNMLLKLAAEDGRSSPLRAVVAVSSPLDLHAASAALRRPRNVLYHRYLLHRMKREALGGRGELSVMERNAILGARDVYAFDDRFIAPRNGFKDAETYYRRCAAGRMLGDVAVPALVIHAADDPWVPADSIVAGMATASPDLRLLLSSGGGHVGFHGRVAGPRDAGGPRDAKPIPWSDARILEFCEENAS